MQEMTTTGGAYKKLPSIKMNLKILKVIKEQIEEIVLKHKQCGIKRLRGKMIKAEATAS